MSARNEVDGPVLRWARGIMSMPPALRFAASVLMVAVVAALDHITGSEASFSIFYLLPVSFAAGLLSRRAGWMMAILSAGVWGYLEVATGRTYSATWIPYWNSAVRFGFFVLVTELIDGIRVVQARERALSRTDPLTAIANARVFEEIASRTIAECRRSMRPFTIVYIDLDRFKHVNDEFGHSEGDRLLRAVAALITENIRGTDVVARLGGDEFGILMPETGAEQARVTLERIMAAIAAEVQERWAVGATFGAVTFSEPPDSVDCAVQQADALMYAGKQQGRGRIMQSIWPASAVECGP